MRFRAKIVDAACLNHFTRVCNMVAKLAKACTLRVSPDKLNFIVSDKLAGGGVSLWCELEQENFFSEFQMEGPSAENNEIYLELVTENLARALRTAQNARALKIKLTHKRFPGLTVSVELLSASSSSRIVTHDIPIKVIPRRLWKDLQEPSVPDSDVSIYLPVLKTMRSVVEKMRNISNHLVIEANLSGELNLKIETEVVCVTTHFKDLGNPPGGKAAGPPASAHGVPGLRLAFCCHLLLGDRTEGSGALPLAGSPGPAGAPCSPAGCEWAADCPSLRSRALGSSAPAGGIRSSLPPSVTAVLRQSNRCEGRHLT
ncbi:checkpoint protein HUS1 isoform X1 [Ochotona curzoniae]|uniref:checkpoint protein HUS1 isoform X1 n=1 Tax=Ochotona curzoniae TaxID=130825 RepID=UPI001B34E3CC|nr:checkpoint protein HUS1 isoform X1 [Ochotona curzoniae]